MGKRKPFSFERIMTGAAQTRYQKKTQQPPICAKCQKPIKVGEIYHRNQAQSSNLYCENCYNVIYIDTEPLEISDEELDAQFSAVIH